MKILLLNPHIDAEHQVVRALQAKGHSVLLPMDSKEATQMLQLHGTSVELAIIHREGIRVADDGLKFLEKLKADSAQIDLPTVVTSSIWGDAEFATHQNSSFGANAYVHWPVEGEMLVELMNSMFGGNDVTTPGEPAQDIVLEDAAPIYLSDEGQTPSEFALDAPQFLADSANFEPSAGEPGGLLVQDPALEALLEAPIDPSMINSPPPPDPSISSVDLGELEGFALPAVGEGEPVDESEPLDAEPLDESELASEMPYLFSRKAKGEEPSSPVKSVPPAFVFTQPIGDAVVPGGAAQAPDVETLKKYLMLREQDVAVLSAQLDTAREQVATLESALKTERSGAGELQRTIDEQKTKIEEFEKDKALALDSLQSEISELRFQIKSKSDKARVLDTQVREAAEEIERVKERVRSDIRKIRVREKELENRLEMMKKDSEALLSSRENKIIELKRKIDLLEFNMDLLQESHSREKESSCRLRERLARAAQVVRAAGGILDTTGGVTAADVDGTAGEGGSKAS